MNDMVSMRKTRPLASGTEMGWGAGVGGVSGFLSDDDLREGKRLV